MPGTYYEREIAQAIFAIAQLKFVDHGWVEEAIGKHLKEFRFERTWLQRAFSRQAYPRSLAGRVTRILAQARSLSLQQIEARVVALHLRDRFARSLSIYFRESRLRDLGFPLYEVPDTYRLFSAALYRFAYGADDQLKLSEFLAGVEFQGAYRVYLKRTGSKNFDSRIIISRLHRDLQSIFSVEISRAPNLQFRVRMGPTAPAFDFQTILLSDQFDRTTVSEVLEENYDPTVPQGSKVDLAHVYRAGDDVALVQSQSLQAYALRNDAANIVSGTFHWKNETGTFIGRKIGKLTAADLFGVRMLLEHEIPTLGATDIDLVERLAAAGTKFPAVPRALNVGKSISGLR